MFKNYVKEKTKNEKKPQFEKYFGEENSKEEISKNMLIEKAFFVYDKKIEPLIEKLKKIIKWDKLDKYGNIGEDEIIRNLIVYNLEPLRRKPQSSRYVPERDIIDSLKVKAMKTRIELFEEYYKNEKFGTLIEDLKKALDCYARALSDNIDINEIEKIL